ncbi:MAG: phosphate ABC transporter permease PstA, partial [Pseudomonadales bacterium]|nr:phosphate ABC transporter permease PstA [Pseudomonadales bacterium]
KRKWINHLALAVAWMITLIGLAIPLWILLTVFERGLSAFNTALFTQMTPPPDTAGGLWNAIVGSVAMVMLATLIATPVAVITGVYLAEYGKNHKVASVIRFVNDILLSAPSIVIGLFVYVIMVVPMKHFSGWAGAVSLAIIALPIMVRTTENMLLLVPDVLREGAYALGATRRQAIVMICIPAARNGIVTGVLLSIARISGETAPLLFTALNNQFYSLNMNQPMANLPVVIFQYAMSPYDNWQALAWAGAALISVSVVVINISARALFRRNTL